MSAESRQEGWALAIASAERKFTEIAAIDGNLVNYQREAMFAFNSVANSDELKKCDTESLRNAVINVASVGLTLNPAMKLAYLVPRKGKACLDISYIGLVKIATDSGGVLAAAAILVRDRDGFVWQGPFKMPLHNYSPFASESERGEIIGVYTVARLASGVEQIDAISREEIDKIRSMSKAKSGPWFDWFDEMVKKSGIKRASKMWPRTERLARAEAILNEHEGNETIIDGTTGEIAQVAGPQHRTEPPASDNPKPAADAGTTEKKDDSPALSEGAKQQLKKQLERSGRAEADLIGAGFPRVDDMKFSRLNEAMEWLKKNPAKAG